MSMRLPKKKADRSSTTTADKVMSALENPKFKYRTADGISREINVEKEKVLQVLRKSPTVRQSIMRSKDGAELFTIKKKVSKADDIWTAFKALNDAKFGDD